jgi:hypothetical protein
MSDVAGPADISLTITHDVNGNLVLLHEPCSNETLRDLLFAALRQCPEGITIPLEES